ncbi:MAG: polysaccharide deacetylase family protein, partial [Aquirufa sp.]
MFIHQIPSFIPALLPRFTWSKAADRQIYLTFDDGPTPEITDFVLECLAEYEAKATFFCIGKNVVENPGIIQRIQAAGHSIGNHTMNHMPPISARSSSILQSPELWFSAS